MKRIIYTEADGSLGVLTPCLQYLYQIVTGRGLADDISSAEKLNIAREIVAQKDVPAGLNWRIVDVSDMPHSRNYRAAWTDENPTETVDVDLEKAKAVQKELMVQKAKERVSSDAFGQQDFSTVQAEMDAIDFDTITDLDTLYNTFPASIDRRKEFVPYAERSKPKESITDA